MKIRISKLWVTFEKFTTPEDSRRIYHRDKGPATLKSLGQKVWWTLDNIHREDGPARMMPGGNEKWILFGYCLTKTEVLSVVANKSSDTYEVGDVLIKKSGLPKWYDGHFPDIYLVKPTGDPGFKVRTRRGEGLFITSHLNLIYNKV